ncbi:MAG: Conserved hypothetical membrane protein, peptidase family M50 [archaeon GW2011_AR17]|nr:MAG: Conserved hypothetical membrane protein, peptidase family M50 [archaeon GW2011_AR17]MBS3154680.1 metalloprotease [Candidatus Woesearchaeota archaeon]HIH14995.1 metalloprotease [Nanoarchaeota archaeon]HIH58723.1 metalloprotease [Nanoarchaeota archaeon]HII13532.1 metalloprotease [Nanoarchaeota archaeon]
MQLKFSKIEIRDLTKAWIAISVAFAIALAGGIIYVQPNFSFLTSILLAALTVGVGFLLHELGHKVIAQRYGCFAEFRADNMMLIIAIITSFFGFLFAAPGAVMIAGRVSTERNGKISIAGPLVNIVLAIIFLVLGIIIHQGFLGQLFAFGFFINTWLAIFNMLPLWILDGKKVWNWNKTIYIITLVFSIALLVIGQFLPLASLA